MWCKTHFICVHYILYIYIVHSAANKINKQIVYFTIHFTKARKTEFLIHVQFAGFKNLHDRLKGTMIVCGHHVDRESLKILSRWWVWFHRTSTALYDILDRLGPHLSVIRSFLKTPETYPSGTYRRRRSGFWVCIHLTDLRSFPGNLQFCMLCLKFATVWQAATKIFMN